VVEYRFRRLERRIDDAEAAGEITAPAAKRLRAEANPLGDGIAVASDRLDRIARLIDWPREGRAA
jgi:hypothetical protein